VEQPPDFEDDMYPDNVFKLSKALYELKQATRYLVHMPHFRLLYPKGSTFERTGYFDFDYARCKVDMKSTTKTCELLERSLMS
jgi:hypothetical protein